MAPNSISELPLAEAPKQVLTDIYHLIADELKTTDLLIKEQLQSNVPLIQTIGQYIIDSGGKRLRLLLVLLSAKACQYIGNEHYELATIVEFVHTATLLHDDVIDASKLRRGRTTANEIWGNQASVLVGDFLYSRAFQLLTKRNNQAVMKVLANTTNAIAEGEILQLANKNDPNINESTYMDVIHRKTACLFSAASEIGAILGRVSRPIQQALADYGLHLGLAFQMIDDLLDYTADSREIGKNIGDDLADGKLTLPLIYALQHATATQQQQIRYAIAHGSIEQLPIVLTAIAETKAHEYTYHRANHHAQLAQQALLLLPESAYKDALYDLIDFIINRNY